MPETAAELRALGGAALKGRRVNRRFLLGNSNRSKYFAGTVTGPAPSGKKSMLVHILYDNEDEEELDAEELEDCILEVGGSEEPPARTPAAKPKRGRPSAGGAGGSTPAKAATPGAASTPGKAAMPAKATPGGGDGDGAGEGTPKSSRPRQASPGKRYKGTTYSGTSWKAQLHAGGKLHYVCGFATEEDAAREWNVLAERFGRSDFNDVPPSNGASPPRAARDARTASPAQRQTAAEEEDDDMPLPEAPPAAKRAKAGPAAPPPPPPPRSSWYCAIQ